MIQGFLKYLLKLVWEIISKLIKKIVGSLSDVEKNVRFRVDIITKYIERIRDFKQVYDKPLFNS